MHIDFCLLNFPHQITSSNNENKSNKQKKIKQTNFSKTNLIKMNPTNVNVISKPVIIVASEVTEKPLNPTNQCSIM